MYWLTHWCMVSDTEMDDIRCFINNTMKSMHNYLHNNNIITIILSLRLVIATDHVSLITGASGAFCEIT